MDKGPRVKVVIGFLWKLLERVGTQGLQFIVLIILARLLTPDDYGTVALITILISIASVFVTSGLNTALIQKKEVDDLDYSSVFYLSMFIAALLYSLLFFLAPYIARFYNEAILIQLIRVLSVTLFFGGVIAIQSAIIARDLAFKKYFTSSLISLVSSACIGIWMAYAGYGVWALVASQLVNNFILTISLFITVKWRPKLLLSLNRLKTLYSFGWKVLGSSLVGMITDNMYELFIGKLYTSEALGHFTRGNQFPQIITSNLNGAISAVLLPVMSSEQDQKDRVKALLKRSIQISSFIVFPMMAGLVAVAEPMVRIVLTDKWLPCVIFLQLNCLRCIFMPLHIMNIQAIYSMGRSDIILKLEVTKTILTILFLLISIPFGIYVMAALRAVTSVVMVGINTYPNKKLLDYGYIELWKDISVPLGCSVFMGIVVYHIIFFIDSIWITLVTQVLAGVLIYIGLSALFKIDSYTYILSIVRELKERGNVI